MKLNSDIKIFWKEIKLYFNDKVSVFDKIMLFEKDKIVRKDKNVPEFINYYFINKYCKSQIIKKF